MPTEVWLDGCDQERKDRDSFDNHDSVADHVESSANGQILAVAVKGFIGGNRLFDLSAQLARARIVIYRSLDEQRILKVPVQPKAPGLRVSRMLQKGRLAGQQRGAATAVARAAHSSREKRQPTDSSGDLEGEPLFSARSQLACASSNWC